MCVLLYVHAERRNTCYSSQVEPQALYRCISRSYPFRHTPFVCSAIGS